MQAVVSVRTRRHPMATAANPFMMICLLVDRVVGGVWHPLPFQGEQANTTLSSAFLWYLSLYIMCSKRAIKTRCVKARTAKFARCAQSVHSCTQNADCASLGIEQTRLRRRCALFVSVHVLPKLQMYTKKLRDVHTSRVCLNSAFVTRTQLLCPSRVHHF